jgi:uncharacterized protein YkwD
VAGFGIILTLIFVAPSLSELMKKGKGSPDVTTKGIPVSLADPYSSSSEAIQEISPSKSKTLLISTTSPEKKPVVVQTTTQNTKVPTPVVQSTVSQPSLQFPEKYLAHTSDELDARKIIYFTNQERQKDGKSLLKENAVLDQAATAKINHMFDNQYFEHVAPVTKEDVVYWVGQVGYAYITVGENLAMGNFKSEEEMVIAWMNSPGHRANILKTSYEEIGVAVGRGKFKGNTVWMGVQVFAVPSSACPAVDQNLLSTITIAESLMKNLEKDLNALYTVISSAPQAQTQEEYDTYLATVARYNDLVAQHKSVIASMTSTVDIYNKEVREYNACLSSK